MKPFVLKQHEVELGRIEELRAEELSHVSGAGPMMADCPAGTGETATVIYGQGPAIDDGCDCP